MTETPVELGPNLSTAAYATFGTLLTALGLRTHEITGGRWSLASDETARAGGAPGAAGS